MHTTSLSVTDKDVQCNMWTEQHFDNLNQIITFKTKKTNQNLKKYDPYVFVYYDSFHF